MMVQAVTTIILLNFKNFTCEAYVRYRHLLGDLFSNYLLIFKILRLQHFLSTISPTTKAPSRENAQQIYIN